MLNELYNKNFEKFVTDTVTRRASSSSSGNGIRLALGGEDPSSSALLLNRTRNRNLGELTWIDDNIAGCQHRLQGFLLGNSHEIEAVTLDLSVGGARFDCDLEVYPGKVIRAATGHSRRGGTGLDR